MARFRQPEEPAPEPETTDGLTRLDFVDHDEEAPPPWGGADPVEHRTMWRLARAHRRWRDSLRDRGRTRG